VKSPQPYEKKIQQTLGAYLGRFWVCSKDIFKSPEIYLYSFFLMNIGKTIMNHPPAITIFIGGINLPFPVVAGL